MNDLQVERKFEFDDSKLAAAIIRRIAVESIFWLALFVILFEVGNGLSNIDATMLVVAAAYILYGVVSIPHSRRVASGSQIILKGNSLSFSTPKYGILKTIRLDDIRLDGTRKKNGEVAEIKISEKNGSKHSIKNYKNMSELARLLENKREKGP